MDKETWCYNVLLSILREIDDHDLSVVSVAEKIKEELEERIRTSDEKEYYSHLYALWKSKNFNIDYEFDIKNEDGFKAGSFLDMAIHGNFGKGQALSNLAQALIKGGANIQNKDYLHACAVYGLPTVLKALIEKGANDIPNKEGETALYCAAKLYNGESIERKECAKILIKDTLEKNPDGEMPDFIKNDKELSKYWSDCEAKNAGWELVDLSEDLSTSNTEIQVAQPQKTNKIACSIQ